MTIPVRCLTPGCSRIGQIINRISGIDEDELDYFYENWADGADPEDFCPDCKQLGVAEDPVEFPDDAE